MNKPKFFGFNAPFRGGIQKILTRQEDDRLIKNDLLQLLLTSPGERIMRPDFGSPIRGFLFENITQEDISVLKAGIIIAIDKFEPRVTTTVVDIITDPDENFVKITVTGSVRLQPTSQQVLFELSVPLGA